ncbi:MAG: hypothetical protein PHV28_06530 [Kiritimatiellae bacterium]|nr:hypothetical protein [Kiritimatiellia bacterium]
MRGGGEKSQVPFLAVLPSVDAAGAEWSHAVAMMHACLAVLRSREGCPVP